MKLQKAGKCALVALVFIGCANMGPLERPKFVSAVSQSLPISEADVLLYSPSIFVRQYKPSGLYLRRKDVVSLFTNESVFVLQWNQGRERYSVLDSMAFRDMAGVSLETLGLGKQIKIRGKDGAEHYLQLTTESGQFVSQEMSTKVFGLLKAKIDTTAATP